MVDIRTDSSQVKQGKHSCWCQCDVSGRRHDGNQTSLMISTLAKNEKEIFRSYHKYSKRHRCELQKIAKLEFHSNIRCNYAKDAIAHMYAILYLVTGKMRT